MKSYKSVIGIMLLVILIQGCQTTVDVDKEKEALLQADRDFSKLSEEIGALKAFSQYLTEDAVQLPTRSYPIVGREAIYKSMDVPGSNYVMKWEPQSAEAAKSGDFGYTWGFYTVIQPDSTGEERTSYGKYFNVWKKQEDGSWKVAVGMGN
ncbi:MAG: nuclear transport factor 2 family protein [candidate division Zixibacteria bacterium]|nr:nuclear transport factor 2 family protein [candidate division Zixibacteria bacterium]